MDETIRTYDRVLSLLGVRFFRKKNWDSRPWFIFQTFNFITGMISFTFTSAYVITNFSNLLLFIDGACIWTTGVVMTLSVGVCFFFRNHFRNFLVEMAFKDRMEELPLIQLVLKKNSGQKLMELKSLVLDSQVKLMKYSRLIMRLYGGISFLCFFLYLCSPIYVMIDKNDSSLRLLAFDIWFPWSLENFKVYVASFTFHAYCAWSCCIIHPGFQSTIILLIGQLIRQLRILGFILLNLNELAIEITRDDPERWQHCCTELLTQCIKHYLSLKNFCNRLNVICRPFYLALILVAIMLVCMCSVKIAISNKLSPGIMKYYVHELCYVLIVLMFSLLCQQVENECECLSQAVTEKWYIFDKSHKENVKIFKMALSQGMPIYIFGSITLSSPTFTWFVKTGMSFFTLVMSVLEEAP